MGKGGARRGAGRPRSVALTVRTSARHWRDLAILLGRFERCAEQAARLDASRRTTYNGPVAKWLMNFEGRVQRLDRDIQREINQVTAERLVSDLARKQAAAAAGQARPAPWSDN